MTFRERLLPQPVVSLAIAVLWLMLASDVSGGQVLLAAALGLVIPIFTSAFWPGRPKRFRIGPALRRIGQAAEGFL